MTIVWVAVFVLLLPVVLYAGLRSWGRLFPGLERKADAIDAGLARIVPLLGRLRRSQEAEERER
jgi:hypothetical protein